MTERPDEQHNHLYDGPKIDRRRVMKLLAGGAVLAASACSHGSAEVISSPTPSPDIRSTFDDGLPQPIQTPPKSTATATPTATPRGSSTPSPLPEPQVLYRGGFSVEPTSHDFNANLYCGGDPSLWSGLLTLNTDLTPMGDWADHWEPNEDSSVWTFHLRQNNTGWSNVRGVTAHDFVWSWQRLIDPATKAPQAWLLYDVVNAVDIHDGKRQPAELGVAAPDNWTLIVNLVGPRVYFPTIVATIGLVPANQQAVERVWRLLDRRQSLRLERSVPSHVLGTWRSMDNRAQPEPLELRQHQARADRRSDSPELQASAAILQR